MNNGKKWYYQYKEGRAGPVSEYEVKRLVEQEIIVRETLVWTEGMKDWEEAYLAGLEGCFEVSTPKYHSINNNSAGGLFGGLAFFLDSQGDLTAKLYKWFVFYWICIIGGFILSSFGAAGLLFFIASKIFLIVIYYHIWGIIPEEKRLVRPLIMVLLLFVPVVNLIWSFVCYYGLAKALNVELRENNIEDVRVSEPLAMVYCICLTLFSIVFIGVLFGVGGVSVTPQISMLMTLILLALELMFVKRLIKAAGVILKK